MLAALAPACAPEDMGDADEAAAFDTTALDAAAADFALSDAPVGDDEDESSSGGVAPDLRTATVDFGAGPVDITFENLGGLAVFEGDMVLGATEAVARGELPFIAAPPERFVGQRSALKHLSAWPGGRVPYVIAPSVPEALIAKILRAVEQWNTQTIARFVPASSSDSSWVRFQPLTPEMLDAGNVGKSALGYQGGGEQGIWLHLEAGMSTIRHEMGHTVGLFHEQSRTDRDQHISINWANVKPHQLGNFQTYVVSGLLGVDFGRYDRGSLMHYSSFGMAIDKTIPTIVRKGCPLTSLDPNCHIQRSGALTDLDRRGVTRQIAGDPLLKFKLRSEAANKCLEPESTSDGARVLLTRCSESTARRWFEYVRAGTSRPMIINEASRLCLDHDDKGNLVQRHCSGVSSQLFKTRDVWGIGNGDRLESASRCVTPSTGAQPVLGSCSDATSRRWFKDIL